MSDTRLGILPISVRLLEYLLHLPEGYRVVEANFRSEHKTLNLTIASDTFPEVALDAEPPLLHLQASVESVYEPRERRSIVVDILPINLKG